METFRKEIRTNRLPIVMKRKGFTRRDLQKATFYSEKYIRKLVSNWRYSLDSDDEAIISHVLGCRPEELYLDIEFVQPAEYLTFIMRKILEKTA